MYQFYNQDYCGISLAKDTWCEMLDIYTTMEDMRKHFCNENTVTNVGKFRSFQCRLLYHAIVFNPYLKRCKITTYDWCHYCGNMPEITEHLLWYCSIIQGFSNDVKTLIDDLVPDVLNEINFSIDRIMFNLVHKNPGNVINFIILIAKQFIYRQK